MPFDLIYYSQKDPQWQSQRLGFSTKPENTIGWVGCTLTSTAMVLSGHGHTINPGDLNKKLQEHKGFAGETQDALVWSVIPSLFPNIRYSELGKGTPAPLDKIDEKIRAGQPVIVQVDRDDEKAGVQPHWVVLFHHTDDGDYLMLDPYPYQTDPTKETYFMRRYGKGKTLENTILRAELFENTRADGKINLPGQRDAPRPVIPVVEGPKARVKPEVNLGLKVFKSEDSSSQPVDTVSAGDTLVIVEPNGGAKIGAVRWVRVRTKGGAEGFVFAQYLEKVPGESYG